MAVTFVNTRCPVCGHHVAVPFFPAGKHTLATLAWPLSSEEAEGMPRHELDFVLCPACSHVYNRAFSYDAIPYEDKPNRMFNRGVIWRGHLAQTLDLLLERLPKQPVVVEIGCGEGHFLRGLAERKPGRYIGFDPNGSPGTGKGLEFNARLFDPLIDLQALHPDLIVIRHVLEHLTEPAALLEQLAWATAASGKPCLLFAEVPCIDRVFETDRLADFFYEHYSHFTTDSFSALMKRAGKTELLAHGYDGEVVYGLVRLGVKSDALTHARTANAFAARTVSHRKAISLKLDELASSDSRVAIWGGTGKGAAFMHYYGADKDRFPLVVDSDREKVGTYVPGTGQSIQPPDVLKSSPVDVVIIPAQWRARDIVAEMRREGIGCRQILIEHGGRLIDFERDEHPYHEEKELALS